MQIKEYLPELSFLALLVRFLFVGAEIGTALAFISIAILMGYKHFVNKSKLDQYEEIKTKIDTSHDELTKQVANLEQTYQAKFDNIAAKFASQNLENAFTKKAGDLQRLTEQMDKVLNGEANVPQNPAKSRRIF